MSNEVLHMTYDYFLTPYGVLHIFVILEEKQRIYVQDNPENVWDTIKSRKEEADWGPLHLEQIFIFMNPSSLN